MYKKRREKKKKEQISKPEKKGSQFLTLSEMDNQRAHTEADGEVAGGDSLEEKCHHLRLTNNSHCIIS